MKILHLLASNKFSGAENVVCQIIDLFKNNNDVENYYCSPNGDIEKSIKDRNINFVGMDKLNSTNLKKVVEKINPDVIHAHDYRAILFASKYYKTKRLIAHIHVNKKSMNKLSIQSLIARYSLKKFNKIFFVSQSALNDFYFKNTIINKSEILYNVINENNVIQKSNEITIDNTFDACFIGRLTEQKNPLRLIEIIKLIKKEKENFKLAVIGQGEFKDILQQEINNSNLQNNIELLGFQSNPFVYLKNSKFMLMTSKWEGTPMCALESFALGVPVISTPTDGMKDIIKTNINGYLYNTNEQAVNYILEIINNQIDVKQSTIKFSNDYNNLITYKNTLQKIYK